MNKVNLFPDLTASTPLISLSNLPNIHEGALVTNSGKASLAKRTARPINALLTVSVMLPRKLLTELRFTKLYIHQDIVSGDMYYFSFLFCCQK